MELVASQMSGETLPGFDPSSLRTAGGQIYKSVLGNHSEMIKTVR